MLKSGRLVYVQGWPAICVDAGSTVVCILPLEGYPEHQAGLVFHVPRFLVECYW
jgi:hypothetical protein